MMFDLIKAALLGVVEGLTEYLPVSSTGHLLLLEYFFGFDDENFGKTFAVLIQLGAIRLVLGIQVGGQLVPLDRLLPAPGGNLLQGQIVSRIPGVLAVKAGGGQSQPQTPDRRGLFRDI